MKTNSILVVVIFLIAIVPKGYSQDYHVRIGFIGNSITYGAGLNNPATDSYPAQLALLLQQKYGDTCIVNNFGISSRTMLKHGDYPIWNDAEFTNCWNLAPGILLICLGTNDTKPQNWDLYQGEFLDDYLSMIDTFKVRNPHTKFLVCYPCPAYDIVWGINNTLIENGVMPLIDSVLNRTDAVLVDFHTLLLDSVALFPDKIHPDLRGSGAMARIVLNTMVESDIVHQVETGLTFINTLKTDKKVLAVNDSATLSWTTINADTVTLDGKLVSANGSLKVSPQDTTVYTLRATGKKSMDMMKLEQQVYYPALTRMSLSPRSINIDQGDSVDFTLYYYDQLNNVMTDTLFDVDWSVTEGYGKLINKTGMAVTFIADSAGKAVLTVKFGDMTIDRTINVRAWVTGINQSSIHNGIMIFPNPGDDIIYLQLETRYPASLQIQLFDLNGTLVKDASHYIHAAGRHTFQILTGDLDPGIYVYQIDYSGKQVTGKIAKKPVF